MAVAPEAMEVPPEKRLAPFIVSAIMVIIVAGMMRHIFQMAELDTILKGFMGGSGLGLFIVREIVIAHGGTISVESSVTAGTVFTIHLPRAPG